MFTKKILFLLVLAFGLILSACSPTEAELPETGDTDLPPAAVLEAQRILSEQLGVTTAEIEIREFEQVEWPDACLGLPAEGEACAQVVTPGFRVVLVANGEEFVFRTDQEGNIVREAPEQEQE